MHNLNMLSTFFVSPDQDALHRIAKEIWAFSLKCQERPLIITTTSGPAVGLRRLLEQTRPKNLPTALAFLPEICGLTQWLEQTPDLMKLSAAHPEIKRWETVYASLENLPEIRAMLGAVGEGGLWALAQAIVAACDKLSESSLLISTESLNSESFDANTAKAFKEEAQALFEAALLEAYPDISSKLVGADGRLIMAFWQHLSTLSDPVPRRHFALARRTHQCHQPLVWIESAESFGAEKAAIDHFLEVCAQTQPVLKMMLDWEQGSLWPECLKPFGENAQAPMTEQFRQSQQALVHQCRQSVDATNWRLIGQKRFEDVAWVATRKIEEHLMAGRTDIALVAQDRLVSRRIRALLTRLGSGISVHDNTGWKLSTTRVASAVQSWLDIVRKSEGPTVSTLLAFLKNPLIDWAALEQSIFSYDSQDISENNDFKNKRSLQECVWEIEQRLLAHEVDGGWSEIFQAFDHSSRTEDSVDPTLVSQTLLQFLLKKSQAWSHKKHSGHTWVGKLKEDLQSLGMLERLKGDSVGFQLLESLEEMRHLSQTPLKLNAWLSLFDIWMEDTSYLEQARPGVASISILTLSATRLRNFDAVVMVGCDDRQFPSFSDPGLFFSNQLLSSLHLKGINEEYIQQARDLSQMLLSHRYVDFIWQKQGASQAENQPSPWLVRLSRGLPAPLELAENLPTKSGQGHFISQSAASWEREKYPLPTSISPSAYKILRECPYHFYATRLLGLRSPRGLEKSSDSSMIGQLLHRILRDFYHRLKTLETQVEPTLAANERSKWMVQTLEEISGEAFTPLIFANGKYLAQWQEWKKQIPQWVAWQIERESQGWKFYDAEKKVHFDLVLDKETKIRIEGYVDRLDLHTSLGASVIDYKYQSATKIKDKSIYIKDDPQLLIYAKAVGNTHHVGRAEVSCAEWVSLKPTKDKECRNYPLEEFEAQLDELPADMARDLSAVWGGELMKASAPESVCQYCEARGLCRKGMWSE